MSQRRLKDLEGLLDLLYEKKAAFEQELELSANPGLKFEMTQRIKREIDPKIRQYEKEYGELISEAELVIDEGEAEVIMTDVDAAVTAIERAPSSVPPEAIALIAELHRKIDALDPTVAASAKLKVALPVIPMLASYELEMDTEGMLMLTRLSDRFRRIRRRFTR